MKNDTHAGASIAGLTLILGGTGKTGRRVAERLSNRGQAIRIASRGVWNATGEEKVA